jgi:hypothetical protein
MLLVKAHTLATIWLLLAAVCVTCTILLLTRTL